MPSGFDEGRECDQVVNWWVQVAVLFAGSKLYWRRPALGWGGYDAFAFKPSSVPQEPRGAQECPDV